ncbi:MAG: hypothetical protein NT069_12925, partial [Planctomycetota bacterium]|nr:hypothetical protein [Planctomycetota bacterium]
MPHCVCFRRLATILFLALGAVGTSFPLARAQGPGSFTLTDSDAGELRETLKKQASDNPMMRGAWTTIEETKDSDDVVSAMTVTAYIDDGRAGDQQLEAILSVLNQSVIKDFKYELKKKRLPVKRLIDQLNSDAELNPRVAGVNIESAYFGPDSDPRKALKLQLTGTSSAPDGRARMEEAARSTAQRLFVNSPVKVDVDAAGVRSVPAQEGIRDAGPRCFAEGVARYRRCDFDGAYQSFTSATKHAPGQVDYQYWRVVSL